MNYETWMEMALDLAKAAAQAGEVPVGCVITLGDQVVGQGRNRREAGRNALCHAEIEAIDKACRALHGHRSGLPPVRRLAAVAVHLVRHPGALPHVCWGYCQRPDSPGGVRRQRPKGRGLRFSLQPVHHGL